MAAEGGGGPPPDAPSSRSPPKYPDFCGRRRLQLEVQILNREVGFLQEELQSLEGLQPVSRCCKEVNEFVGTNPDPLIPLNKKKHGSCRIWKWLRSKLCITISWICCSTGCSPNLKRPSCSCCPRPKNCCSCRCHCECPNPPCCCEVSSCRPPPCCYCFKFYCCRRLPRCCCTLPRCCRFWEISCCRPPQSCCCYRELSSCCRLPRCICACPEYSCGCIWDCPRCT